jgi:hypothetical protein
MEWYPYKAQGVCGEKPLDSPHYTRRIDYFLEDLRIIMRFQPSAVRSLWRGECLALGLEDEGMDSEAGLAFFLGSGAFLAAFLKKRLIIGPSG